MVINDVGESPYAPVSDYVSPGQLISGFGFVLSDLTRDVVAK